MSYFSEEVNNNVKNKHPFLAQKFARIFDYHDLTGDGKLDQADIDAYCKAFFAAYPDCPEDRKTQFQTQIRLNIDDLVKSMDKDGVGYATRQQCIDHCFAIMTPDGVKYKQLVEGYSTYLVKVIDYSGDNKISLDEYLKWANCNPAVFKKSAEACFKKCDLNSDNFITPDEVVKCINQFFQSVNPEDPGNTFFGEL